MYNNSTKDNPLSKISLLNDYSLVNIENLND